MSEHAERQPKPKPASKPFIQQAVPLQDFQNEPFRQTPPGLDMSRLPLGNYRSILQLQRIIGNQAVQRLIVQSQRNELPADSTPAFADLQRKPPPAPATKTNRWKSLPQNVQDVLEVSFITRHKNEWIWRKGPSAVDCFNKLPVAYYNAFIHVQKELEKAALWLWVERVSNIYTQNVEGIYFKPDSRADLVTILSRTPDFCRDTRLGGGASTPKWRQLSKAGSPGLHIILPTSGLCQAHIDTITPIEGRESDGTCNYSVYHGLRHIKKDLLGR